MKTIYKLKKEDLKNPYTGKWLFEGPRDGEYGYYWGQLGRGWGYRKVKAGEEIPIEVAKQLHLV